MPPTTSTKGTYLQHRPHDLTVIGVDTNDTDDHYLYDHRAPEFMARLRHPKYKAIIDAYYKAESPPALIEIAEALELPSEFISEVIEQESFIRSIEKVGVRTPIDATKDGEASVVVTGRLRVLGARIAESRTKNEIWVPSMMFAGDELRSLDAIVSENENRTADTPLNRGRKAIKLIAYGLTHNTVARLFRVDPKTLNQWIALGNAPLKLQGMVEQGEMPASSAMRLATSSLTKKEMVDTAQEMVGSGDTTMTATAAHIRRVKAEKAPKTPAQQKAAKKASRSVDRPAAEPGAQVIMRPSKKQLRWAAKWGKETGELSPEIIKTILWMLGDIPASKVTGMAKAMRAQEAEGGKQPKRAKAAAEEEDGEVANEEAVDADEATTFADEGADDDEPGGDKPAGKRGKKKPPPRTVPESKPKAEKPKKNGKKKADKKKGGKKKVSKKPGKAK